MKLFLIGTACSTLALASPANAQTAGTVGDAPATQDDGGSNEVIITANRRQESVQQSSLAVSVVGGDALAQAQVTNATDLQNIVPGLTVSAGGATAQAYLRGVGSFATDASAESAIAYNINGVYISRPNGIGPIFFDLERVEVLKGPQGTLYGRNASGGAINVITRRPTQDLSGEFSVDLGNYDLVRVTGAMGGGITDTLSVRAAAQYSSRDGYLTDGYNDQDSFAGRVSALWRPAPNVSLYLMGEYAQVDGMGAAPVKRSTLTAVPANPWEGPSVGNAQQPPTAFIPGGTRITDLGNQDVTLWAVSAQLDVDLGSATLTFLPAYRDTSARYLTFTPGFFFNTRETSRQQSYELRLANAGERLRWVAGLYYFDEDQTQVYELQAIPIQRGTTTTPLTTRSYAAFADVNFSLSDTFRLLGGIRYSDDRKTQAGQTVAVLPAPATTSNAGRVSDDQITWRAGVELDVGPQNMLFATISTGYKSGGLFPSVPAPNNQFAPEHLTAFTIGSRNRFLGNALQINVEGFYWRYDDKQERFLGATPSGTTGLLTTNAGEATLYGVNVDVVARPWQGGRLHVGVEYLHTKYDSFVYQVYNPSVGPFLNSYPVQATGCALGPVTPYTSNDFIPALQGDSTQAVDCSGMPLVRAPKWSGLVSYEHRLSVGDGHELIAGVDGQFSSSQYLTPDFIRAGRDNGFVTINADLTLALRNGLSVTVWGRNLTKEAIYSGGFRYPFSRAVAAGGDPTLFYATIRDPRTYGISARYRF